MLEDELRQRREKLPKLPVGSENQTAEIEFSVFELGDQFGSVWFLENAILDICSRFCTPVHSFKIDYTMHVLS